MAKDNAELLKVRISIGDGKDVIGSGILLRQGPQQKALILTAAHVVDQICSKEDKGLPANFECSTPNQEIKTIRMHITKALDSEELRYGSAYVHRKYIGESDCYRYDAAIIAINLEPWMEELPTIQIKNYDFENEEAKGIGFPESMDGVYGKETEHAGQKDIKGVLKNFEKKGNGVRFSYEGTQNYDYKVGRDTLLKGFSGTGLIVRNSGKDYFAGVVSHGAGKEKKAGTEMWIAPSDFFMDIIPKAMGTLPKLEMNESSVETLDLEDLSLSDEYIRKLKRRMSHGIAYNGWNRENFESQIKEHGLLKCEGNRDSCEKNIYGLLKRAVIFQGLKIPLKEEMNYLQPNSLNQQGNYLIFLEYLCTENPSGKIVFELLENQYFARDQYVDKATIFIVNSKNKITSAGRKKIGKIITNIVNEKEKLNLEEFGIDCEKDASLDFDIITGRILNCKMAMVAIDDLVSNMEGDEEDNLKGELDHLWNIN